MEYTEIVQILLVVCPAVTALLSCVGGAIGVVRVIKTLAVKSSDEKKKELETIDKYTKALNKLNARVNSVERLLLEDKEK